LEVKNPGRNRAFRSAFSDQPHLQSGFIDYILHIITGLTLVCGGPGLIGKIKIIIAIGGRIAGRARGQKEFDVATRVTYEKIMQY
jgi:hypothetical protein